MTCFFRSKVEWVSGLNHQFAKLTYWKRYPGFESRLHRKHTFQALTHSLECSEAIAEEIRCSAQLGSASRFRSGGFKVRNLEFCFLVLNKWRSLVAHPDLDREDSRFET